MLALVPAQGYQGGWSGCGRCKGAPLVSICCLEAAEARLWREEAAEALGCRRHRGTLFPSAARKQPSRKQRGEGGKSSTRPFLLQRHCTSATIAEITSDTALSMHCVRTSWGQKTPAMLWRGETVAVLSPTTPGGAIQDVSPSGAPPVSLRHPPALWDRWSVQTKEQGGSKGAARGSSHVKLRLPLEHNSGDSCCFCGQCAAGQKSREGRGWAQRCAPGRFPL